MFRPYGLRLMFAVVALSVTAGCESSVVTRFDPTTDPAHATVQVVLTGSVVDAIDEKPALDQQLTTAFTNAAGETPTRRRTEVDGQRALILSAEVPLSTVTGASGLTGVAGLSATGEDPVTVSVTFADPVKLREALNGFGDQAATDVALASTYVTFEMHFPGGVQSVVGQVPYSQDGGTVTVRQTVGSFMPGSLVVTGSPQGSSWWVWAVAGLVLAGGLAFVLRKRR